MYECMYCAVPPQKEFSRLGVWAMDRMAEEQWAVFFDVLLLMALR
jgi:hypothetical protein